MTPLKFLLGMLFLKMLFLYEHSSYLKFLICYFYILLWKLSCFIKIFFHNFRDIIGDSLTTRKKMFITKTFLSGSRFYVEKIWGKNNNWMRYVAIKYHFEIFVIIDWKNNLYQIIATISSFYVMSTNLSNAIRY